MLDIIEKVSGSLSHGATNVVGINGLDCSGKTTLAMKLRDFFEQQDIPSTILCVDDFNNFDFQNIFYQSYMESGIEAISIDEYYENSVDYDGLRDAIIESSTKSDILIVEGVFLYKPMLVPLFTTKVFLEVTLESACERYSKRKLAVGDKRPTSVMSDIWYPAYLRYVKECNPKQCADFVSQT